MVEIKEHKISKSAETCGDHSINIFLSLAPALDLISSTTP